MKIEKLTKEQEVRLIETHEYWLKVGLSTERANRPKTEETISSMYELIGKKAPRFIWMYSPFGCMISISLEKKCSEIGANLWDNLLDNLGSNLRANLWDNLRANLGNNLLDNLRANLGNNLLDNLRANLRANLGNNLLDNLRANLRDNLWDNLRANLGNNLLDNLLDNLRDNNLFENTDFWGSLDSYWISYYKFANEICVRYAEKDSNILDKWAELAHSCFWFWTYENYCFVSEKPTEIHRNKEGHLHNTSGLSLKFNDGYGFFSLNGVRVPAWVVETDAEKIDTEKVINEKNVEVRRELIRKIGMERFIQKSGAKVLDKQGDYELLSVHLSDEVQDARYLKMMNPSIGVWHVEGVEGNTVQEAINFRAGNLIASGENWKPSILT